MNKEENLYGIAFGSFLSIFIGWWAILTAILCSIFWALSGMNGQSKLWRRLMVPFIGCVCAWVSIGEWYAWVPLPICYGMLSVGYGIPSTQPPDPGSVLGRFWYRITNGNEKVAHILTRLTIMVPIFGSFTTVRAIYEMGRY